MAKNYKKRRKNADKKRLKIFQNKRLSKFMKILWKYILHPLIEYLVLNSPPIKYIIESIFELLE